MHALSDQLIDLKMDDAVPMENLIVEEGAGDGPNAPSPSESNAIAAAAAAAAAAAPKPGGSRSQLKAQKHQVMHEGANRHFDVCFYPPTNKRDCLLCTSGTRHTIQKLVLEEKQPRHT